MTMRIVVAYDEKRAIGKDGKIPWYIPDDLQWFKTITAGKTVVMGRKTFESIGKPLPNRTNIVLSNRPERLHKDIIQIDNPNFVVDFAKTNEVMIIGGGEVYAQFMNLCDIVYATELKVTIGGDTFFPMLPTEFKLVSTWPNVYNNNGEDLKYDIKVYKK